MTVFDPFPGSYVLNPKPLVRILDVLPIQVTQKGLKYTRPNQRAMIIETTSRLTQSHDELPFEFLTCFLNCRPHLPLNLCILIIIS